MYLKDCRLYFAAPLMSMLPYRPETLKVYFHNSFGGSVGISNENGEVLLMMSTFRYIGKDPSKFYVIGIYDGSYTDEEWEILKKDPEITKDLFWYLVEEIPICR